MQARPRQKILVVEDELLVRLDLAQAIHLEGREVSHVPSAEEALELLARDKSIGLVFTDIKMPGIIDGIELAKKIRQRWPSISVVVSSGNIATDARCHALGAPLMHKPYRLSELRRLLTS